MKELHARGRRSLLKAAAAALAAPLFGACDEKRPAQTAPARQARFADGALRLELLHASRAGSEAFQLTRVRFEPAWPGPRTRLADAPAWGDYRLSLYDTADDALLFRCGFDSTAGSAPSTSRLTLRLPMPLRVARASIEKRRGMDIFQPISTQSVEPHSAQIDRSPPAVPTDIETLRESGPPHTRVDLAILGDGYTQADRAKFIADARRAADFLFSVDPFRKRQDAFNVRAVFAASAERGITDPSLGISRDTVLRCAYGSGASERTLAATDARTVSEAASAAPHDFVLVVANAHRYGGSALYGGAAVAAIDSAFARYLVLHELGHVIGGLAEEYYVPSAGGPRYAGDAEPWQPNVTLSPTEPKWRSRLTPGIPLPTRWNKAEYDSAFARYVKRFSHLRERGASESAIENLMSASARAQHNLLSRNSPPGAVGAFEGAHGYAQGLYRSGANCIMFSLQSDAFCAACSDAIERMIDYHTQ